MLLLVLYQHTFVVSLLLFLLRSKSIFTLGKIIAYYEYLSQLYLSIQFFPKIVLHNFDFPIYVYVDVGMVYVLKHQGKFVLYSRYLGKIGKN